ncbi:MAG: hypothetical protein WD003_00845 [Candidatus Paceibacterota bacterium]
MTICVQIHKQEREKMESINWSEVKGVSQETAELVDERIKTFTPGMYWHVHHNEEAIEFCWDYKERVACIVEKFVDERELRLQLFKPVMGEIPSEVEDAVCKLAEAERKYDEANRERDEAQRRLIEADREWNEAHRRLAEAERKYDEARRERDEANRKRAEAGRRGAEADRKLAEALIRHRDELMSLHEKECGCSFTDEHPIIFPACTAVA